MSNKFFRNPRALFMFDPKTYKTYVYETGKWVESNESGFLDEIRFHTVELSMSEVLDLVLSRREEQNCPHPVRMRTTPTVNIGGTWNTVNTGAFNFIPAPEGFLFYTVSLAAGNIGVNMNSSDDYLEFSAEL